MRQLIIIRQQELVTHRDARCYSANPEWAHIALYPNVNSMPSNPPPTKRKLRSFSRDELREAINDGARCVTFQYCYSLLHTFHGQTDIWVVYDWMDGVRTGFWHTLGTSLFGWWGVYGLILTPICLFQNLRGGNDVTAQVLATLESDALSARIVSPEFEPLDVNLPSQTQSPDDFLRQLGKDDRLHIG